MIFGGAALRSAHSVKAVDYAQVVRKAHGRDTIDRGYQNKKRSSRRIPFTTSKQSAIPLPRFLKAELGRTSFDRNPARRASNRNCPAAFSRSI